MRKVLNHERRQKDMKYFDGVTNKRERTRITQWHQKKTKTKQNKNKKTNKNQNKQTNKQQQNKQTKTKTKHKKQPLHTPNREEKSVLFQTMVV